MLQDLIMELLTAGDKEEKEKAYQRLERVGIDCKTADELAAHFYQKGGSDSD